MSEIDEVFVCSSGVYYVVGDLGRIEIDPVEELTQMSGQIGELRTEIERLRGELSEKTGELETCHQLLWEATLDPEPVVVGDATYYKIVIWSEWLDAAKKAVGWE